SGEHMPCRTRAIRHNWRMHYDKAMPGCAFGENAFEPSQALRIVSIEKAKKRAAMFEMIKCRFGAGSILKERHLIAKKGLKNFFKCLNRALARDIMIAFSKKKWDAQSNLPHKINSLSVLLQRQFKPAT